MHLKELETKKIAIQEDICQIEKQLSSSALLKSKNDCLEQLKQQELLGANLKKIE